MNKVVTFGEIMMRLSAPSFQRFSQAASLDIQFGGSEANVGMSLSGLGIPSAHVTRFPQNEFGDRAVKMLKQYNVDTSFIAYGPERMGLYFLENGAMQRSSKIIYDRFDSAFAKIEPGMINWDEALRDAQWFHWTGITPAISDSAAATLREALYIARKKNITVSADINYRRNLWQYGKTTREVMPELIFHSHHLVAGITDLNNCLGISSNNYEDACTKVFDELHNVRSISTTTRNSISASHNLLSGVLLTREGNFSSRSYDLIPIVDRVGAGDAFMAGLIYGWITQKHEQDIIEFAVAASAFKHSIEGDVNIAAVKEIESLKDMHNVGILLR